MSKTRVFDEYFRLFDLSIWNMESSAYQGLTQTHIFVKLCHLYRVIFSIFFINMLPAFWSLRILFSHRLHWFSFLRSHPRVNFWSTWNAISWHIEYSHMIYQTIMPFLSGVFPYWYNFFFFISYIEVSSIIICMRIALIS